MRTLLLAACLLPAAVSARAETPPAQVPQAATAQPENTELITPLNVRDPSALVMGPWGKVPDVTVLPVPRAPEPPGVKAKIAVDKTPLEKGKRAVALAIDEDQLLSVKPGDRVDVLGVFDAVLSTGPKQAYAATILQNARVLSVAATGDLRAKGVVTLELNPNEAQYALLFARRTELGLALRAPGEAETHPFEMATFGKLFR